jgi:putative effector of murein hydrolase
MSKEDDEFDVVIGEPQKRNDYSFVGRFLIVSVVFAALIFVFQSSIEATGSIMSPGATAPITVSAVVLAGIIGWLQTLIFKQDIQKIHTYNYIFASVLGGFLGGLVGGILRSSELVLSGFWIGLYIGLAGGAVSSLIQNRLLARKEHAEKWFWFSTISWGIIWGIGWAVSWGIGGYAGISLAAAIIVAFCGASLAILKQKYRFEF